MVRPDYPLLEYQLAYPSQSRGIPETDKAELAKPTAEDLDAIAAEQKAAEATAVSGGTPPYKQPVVDPSSPSPLPPGLSFATDGNGNVTVSGTPTVPGSGTFILSVADSGV